MRVDQGNAACQDGKQNCQSTPGPRKQSCNFMTSPILEKIWWFGYNGRINDSNNLSTIPPFTPFLRSAASAVSCRPYASLFLYIPFIYIIEVIEVRARMPVKINDNFPNHHFATKPLMVVRENHCPSALHSHSRLTTSTQQPGRSDALESHQTSQK